MMSLLSTDQESQLSELLSEVVKTLDVPPELLREAIERYDDLGSSLAGWADDRGGAAWTIYPQGSILIGTTVRPARPSGEYDVDLVCVHGVERDSVTKDELKKLVGDALQEYVDTLEGQKPVLSDGKRCWTLVYPGQFHMDVLPAVPRTSRSDTGIWITDRHLWNWLESDPKAYADWFWKKSRQFDDARAVLAKRAASTVEEIRPELVRTPLQRAVQVIKQHRNVHFERFPELRPPSIVLTTLVAQTYDGTSSVYEAVRKAAETMHAFVRLSDSGPSVPNPVCDEDFAERWRSVKGAVEAFGVWQRKLREDVREYAESRGNMVRLGHSLKRSLGDRPVDQAFSSRAGSTLARRQRNELSMAPSGLLVAGSGMPSARPIPDHNFFGA